MVFKSLHYLELDVVESFLRINNFQTNYLITNCHQLNKKSSNCTASYPETCT